jgi:uncharacterized protein
VTITNNFKPAWWLPSRHLQTLWPQLRRFNNKLALRRERVELADGDFVDLDWSPQDSGPLVLVLHGLEGSSDSPYARGLLNAFARQGWRCAVLHFRGCSGEHNRLPRAYHSGDTADVAAVIALLRAREPHTPLAAVGVSLGANVLLKWLGETGATNPLLAAVAISVPFDLSRSVDYLQQGFSRFYDNHLLSGMQKKFTKKFAALTTSIALPSLHSLTTLREFDDKITAPLHGFVDAEDYYTRASCKQFLPHITIPTLIINAHDDPFVPPDVIPKPHELAAKTILEITEEGGHVGFVSGKLPWRPVYWLDDKVPHFLKNHF